MSVIIFTQHAAVSVRRTCSPYFSQYNNCSKRRRYTSCEIKLDR